MSAKIFFASVFVSIIIMAPLVYFVLPILYPNMDTGVLQMAKEKELYTNRTGQYQSQPGGYRAFIPKPLPPDPPIFMDEELTYLLSLADRAVGRLDASTDNVPDPDFFVTLRKLIFEEVAHRLVMYSR